MGLFEHPEPAAVVAAALASTTRLRMLAAVAERPRTIGELGQLVGLTQSCASYQVRRLAEVGLVDIEPEGTRRIVRAVVREVRLSLDG